jgi:hypothetical protein
VRQVKKLTNREHEKKHIAPLVVGCCICCDCEQHEITEKKTSFTLFFFHSLYSFLILFTPTVQINHQTTGREGRKAIWPTKELKETQKLYRIKNCGVFFVSFPSLSLSKHFSACNIIRFIFIVIVIIVVWSGF